MLVFIDESGDPGLKLGGGSSDFFIVTLIVFEDNDDALAADQQIERLREELGFRREFEFKSNKLEGAYREAFLSAVSKFSLFYFSLVINKRKLTGPGFRFKESFYKYTCGLVFENAKPYLDQATVVIDGSGSRGFRRQLGSYLRKRVNEKSGSRFIRKVKMQDSRKNNLLQMTDMVCGAVARTYTQKAEAQRYRRLIAHREIHVQFWPK